ncbi:hypothetical protein Tco_0256485 [Tanacetum coccineum]
MVSLWVSSGITTSLPFLLGTTLCFGGKKGFSSLKGLIPKESSPSAFIFLAYKSSGSDARIRGYVILHSRLDPCASSVRRHSQRVSLLVTIVATPLAVGNLIIEWIVEATDPKLLILDLPNITLRVCVSSSRWADLYYLYHSNVTLRQKDCGCRLSPTGRSLSSSFHCPRRSGCRDVSDGHRGLGVVFLSYTVIVPRPINTEAIDSGHEPSFVAQLLQSDVLALNVFALRRRVKYDLFPLMVQEETTSSILVTILETK